MENTLDTTTLWNAFSERLLAFIRGRVRDSEDARDLLQEVFLKIHQNLATLSRAERPEAWIYRVARNAIVDHYRKRRPEITGEDLPRDLPEVEDEDVLRGMVECLMPFIEALPDKYKIVVEMSELKGIRHKEIAAELGIGLSAVKSRVVRAREMIRGHFEECCHVKLSPEGVLVRTEDECGRCGCS